MLFAQFLNQKLKGKNEKSTAQKVQSPLTKSSNDLAPFKR
jgi:hypothetical protein